MKYWRLLLVLISFNVSAQANLQQYHLKIIGKPSGILKSTTDTAVKILNGRLFKSGYQNSVVTYDAPNKQFVITGKDILDSNFIRLWLIKPFEVMFYETYSLEQLERVLSSHKKSAKIIELQNEFLALLNITASNIRKNKPAHLGILKLSDTAKFNKVKTSLKSYLPADIIFAYAKNIIPSTADYIEVFGLRNNISKLNINRVLETCETNIDDRGYVSIWLEFNKIGKTSFATMTRMNRGNPLAIVIDNRVYSAPFVNGEVEAGVAEISGVFTMKEAQQMVDVLSIGYLPVRLGFIQ